MNYSSHTQCPSNFSNLLHLPASHHPTILCIIKSFSVSSSGVYLSEIQQTLLSCSSSLERTPKRSLRVYLPISSVNLTSPPLALLCCFPLTTENQTLSYPDAAPVPPHYHLQQFSPWHRNGQNSLTT